MAVFDGLIHIPCDDLNFVCGIERLSMRDLKAMLEKLTELQAKGELHKGRIKTVNREIKKRGMNGVL